MPSIYVVATPIGNLKDITIRALEVLKSVDYILAEDTRVISKLLKSYKIENRLISYHQHSSKKVYDKIIELLKQGKNCALVSDAGTPGISDPGGRLVKTVYQVLGNQVSIIAIPGPSALASALSVSGLSADRFIFYGFLPHKKGRQKLLKEIAQNKITSALFESPHRIIKTLESLALLLDNNRHVVVTRELTKKFETVYRGTVNQVMKAVKNDIIKGEFVIIISKA